MVSFAKRCEPVDRAVDLRACERACQLNHSNSCANWGQLLAESDPEQAEQLFARACVGGSGIGCESRAQRLAAQDKDALEAYATARNYHRVHCAQGYARSCAQLALLFQKGLGGPVNPETSREFAKRACQMGWSRACTPPPPH